MRRGRAFWLLALLLVPVGASAEITWPVELYDPAAKAEPPAPADLVLPMPCGGAMAFQRIAVPLDAADPLADRGMRLGQSQPETGYSDYLLPEHLRGGFTDADAAETYYYIARYELTAGQYRALTGDCAATTRADRLAKGDLSWFEAVDLSRGYSEWLLANAGDALPRRDGAPAFVRLPTEVEWEYAARGGARADPTAFAARRYFTDGSLLDHAFFQGAGSARGAVGPVGVRAANPLGLYDIYGNLEELQLEPFRLNAVGRPHGQVGGLVTRGGSFLSTEDQIYTAARTEYPMFGAEGAQAAPTFGARFALGVAVTSSDALVAAIQARWRELADSPPQGGGDPLAALNGMIEEEADPRRSAALSDVQLGFRLARDAAQTALAQSAKANMLSGAVFVATIEKNNRSINQLETNIRTTIEIMKSRPPNEARQLRDTINRNLGLLQDMRTEQEQFLRSFRAALDSLTTDSTPEGREAAYSALRADLEASDQADLAARLDQFALALEAFADRPDMTEAELIELTKSD